MSAPRRWDPAPLVAATGESARQVARRLKVSGTKLTKPLTDAQADAYSIRLGLHPVLIWPDYHADLDHPHPHPHPPTADVDPRTTPDPGEEYPQLPLFADEDAA